MKGIPSRLIWLLAILGGISLGTYLGFSSWTYGIGFPLDDAWIHQTYARQLGQQGEWAFLPGQPSAGSTSPLWTLLLAPAHAINLGPYIWTYLLGGVLLWLNSLTGFFLLLHLQRTSAAVLETRDGQRWAFWGAIFLILEWHLVWAAGSGMETLLFAWLSLLVIVMVSNPSTQWWKSGVLIGISVWVRPDGVTLLGPALLILLLMFWKDDRWILLKKVAELLGGFGLCFGGYLLFNYLVAGAWWPNTFFAKQAEYAILRSLPYGERLLAQWRLPLVGAGALLLPGFLWYGWQAWEGRRWPELAAWVWAPAYLALYAWRLPVTYQYGRYAIPAMNVFFVLGLAGWICGLRQLKSIRRKRLLERTWLLAQMILLLVFWGRGAAEYALGVAVIETEMVAVAHWVAQNTPEQALIAAHDIGALGYFGQRRLVDLAGLVSPEVIPFIRDEEMLAKYLDDQGADFLVTFPGWYPRLVQGRQLIFRTQGSYSLQMGGENMAVYRWRSP